VGVAKDLTEHEIFLRSLAAYKQAVDSSLAAVVITDAQERLTHVNPTALRRWGITSPDAALGRHISEFLVQDQRYSQAVQTLRTLQPWEGWLEAVAADGSLFTVRVLANVIQDASGRLLGYTASLWDETTRLSAEQSLRHSERLYRGLFEKSLYGVILHDVQGRILDANQTALDIFGYALEDFLLLHPRDLVHPDQVLEVGRQFQAMAIGEEVTAEARCLRKDGAEIRIIARGRKIGRDLIQGVVQDVTSLRAMERFKQDVERILRHDLKSPLHGIINMPQVLLEESDLADDHRECLRLIMDAGRRMLDMINLSLALQRVEHGLAELDDEEFDLLEVVRRTLAEQAPLAQGKGLRLVLETRGFDQAEPQHVPVRGKRLMAYSVVSNLLQNALEASPQEVPVRLLLCGDGSATVLEVRNRGAVPPAVRDRFFEKFTTAGKKNGTGLGTYSARLFCRAQGWDIAMRTDEHEGTALTVRIPGHDGGRG
jgi:PAS domain S-box-containing protein